MSGYELVVDRVEGVCPLLLGEARQQAERVVALCRELALRPRSGGMLMEDDGDLDRKRELGRLAELLGRRATNELPAASLGRLALADLHGDRVSFELACRDCGDKLALLGF